LEKQGKPTVTICSDSFASLAATIALAKGMPSLTRVVIPHPIAGLPAQEVRAKADRAMEEILKALLGT
jgi:hypothetical protein